MSDSEVVENEIFDGGVVEGSWLRGCLKVRAQRWESEERGCWSRRMSKNLLTAYLK